MYLVNKKENSMKDLLSLETIYMKRFSGFMLVLFRNSRERKSDSVVLYFEISSDSMRTGDV